MTLLVFCWATAATFSTAYYSFKFTDLLRRLEAVPVHVSVSKDYGNQTTITFEEVYLFSSATALDSLRAVANVTTEYHEVMGLLVTGVDGLSNDWAGAGKGWQYWLNGQYALEAADMLILVSGDIVDWRYTTYQGPG
ncbi:MAG: DUF4430 domain-containing protein [Candidatus Bathyarchaeota archaeon]|jgi:hypothetical protein|nr:MAG: DUF4430 domain-containing protein [Candidatus Bathyarchaeota archaeon]